jgi:DNA-binding response OmpR family regulator
MTRKTKADTVLIIEDDADIRTFASRVLELEGYRILQSETGEKGLRLAREKGVSLILLDLRLPGESGWTLLEKMKGAPETAAIPVIVFTASVAASQHQRALAMGAADYLTKPLSASALKNTVVGILRKR